MTFENYESLYYIPATYNIVSDYMSTKKRENERKVDLKRWSPNRIIVSVLIIVHKELHSRENKTEVLVLHPATHL